MITIEKVSTHSFFYNDLELNIKYFYTEGKIWLTKKDIAKIFGLDKKYLKAKLNILINDGFVREDVVKNVFDNHLSKTKTYYSLDLLILLGYGFKSYEETKFLIKTNKMIKKYIIPSKIKFISLYIAGIFNMSFNLLRNIGKVV